MSTNRVVLIGRLTRDPEIRTLNSGKTIASFSIAVDKRFKPQDGSPTADFFRVTAWEKTADFVGNYLGKGRLIAVDGRLQSRKYTDKDGNPRETVEVVAESVQGLDRPKDGAEGAEPTASAPKAAANAPKSAATTEADYDPFADE